MGRSGRGRAYHPDKREEDKKDAEFQSNLRALDHLELTQSKSFRTWSTTSNLYRDAYQLQATLDALSVEERDDEAVLRMALWSGELEEVFSNIRGAMLRFPDADHEHCQLRLNELIQGMRAVGEPLFPLADRVVAEGFDQAFEHFNGIYEALKDDQGENMQLYAHIGNLDKGFKEIRHGFVELGSPYLYRHYSGSRPAWIICERFMPVRGTTACVDSDVFSPEHIEPESVWACMRRHGGPEYECPVTIRISIDADLVPQKRWHKATPNLASWSSRSIPPVDVEVQRTHKLLHKLGGRKANVQRTEMPNDRGIIRTTHKNQLGLRTRRELRITPSSAVKPGDLLAISEHAQVDEVPRSQRHTEELVMPEDSVSQCGADVDILDVAEVAADQESSVGTGMTSRSYTSFTSVATSEGHCYVPNTVIKDVTGRYVPVKELQISDLVYGTNGHRLQITSHIVHPPEQRELVTLKALDAYICVTGTHYVMVQRGCEHVRARADSLKVGEDIVCSSGVCSLHEIQRMQEFVEVVQITFYPDEPVEMVHLPLNAILTRGSREHKGTRRGRRSTQVQWTRRAKDEVSIPDTIYCTEDGIPVAD